MSGPHDTTPIEIRPIPQYPGYFAGNDGSIWSNRRYHGKSELRRLACYTNSQRRQIVNINDPTTGHVNAKVHALVLSAFVGVRPPGMECCHNNGDPSDNRIENLRWDTRRANYDDEIRHGTQKGTRNPSAKLTEHQVSEMRQMIANGAKVCDLAAMFHVSNATVSMIANRRIWTHVS